MNLSNKELEVYSRQIIIKDVGEEGQRKLRDSSVLVVGCGGLGAPVLYYLTAMGIGHIGLCDGDAVSLPNLNRQILFTSDDIGKQKASTARERLTALNPDLTTTVYDKYLDNDLAETIIPAYDIAVDCLDNFESRFILNDACVKVGKPFVHAGLEEFNGQLMTITPGEGPCLRCLFPNGVKEKGEQVDDSSASSGYPKKPGVIGPTPGVLGAMQAMEVAKYLLGLQVCNDGLVMYDGLKLSTEKVPLKASSKCNCCHKDYGMLQNEN